MGCNALEIFRVHRDLHEAGTWAEPETEIPLSEKGALAAERGDNKGMGEPMQEQVDMAVEDLLATGPGPAATTVVTSASEETVAFHPLSPLPRDPADQMGG